MATSKRIDVYQMVTDRILAELDKGNIPWNKPWIRPTVTRKGIRVNLDPASCAYSRSTGKPYSLLNQMLLGKAGEWATFKQIKEAGGNVKKGEKSSFVVFWKFIQVQNTNAQGEEVTEEIPMLRYFSVFHVESQTEGITVKAAPHTEEGEAITATTAAEWNPIEEAESVARHYLEAQGIQHHAVAGDRAYYSPTLDYIQTPAAAQFKDPAEYYSTLFHEMAHSTGHPSRLDRFSCAGSHAFGSENYSREELVAEISAAALVNFLGIESKGSFKNSAAYVQSWSKHLREDPKAIVTASSRAEKAVNLILA